MVDRGQARGRAACGLHARHAIAAYYHTLIDAGIGKTAVWTGAIRQSFSLRHANALYPAQEKRTIRQTGDRPILGFTFW